MEASIIGALILGLVIGMRHAFDPDHLVAVSTIVSGERNPLRSLWIGISWGLGHTTTLVVVGVVIIVLRQTIPDGVALLFELGVGIMIVLLGAQVLWHLYQSRVHAHRHMHPAESHIHFHSHEETPEHAHRGASEWLRALRPVFRRKSYVIGIIHGLAGSAALLLLTLSTLDSAALGVLYIFLFGLGSVVSMGAVTLALGLPLSLSSRAPLVNTGLQTVAGLGGLAFGGLLIYQIIAVENVFTHL